MALTQRQFSELLRQSYPDAHTRFTELVALRRPGRGWASPRNYENRPEREAAAIGQLLQRWDRLDDDVRIELTRLAGRGAPLADVYNFCDYRSRQTFYRDHTTGKHLRPPTGPAGWKPYLEPPTTDATQATEAVSRMVSDWQVRTWSGQDLAQPAPGSPRPPGAQDPSRPSTGRGTAKDGPQQGI
ncbi:hypothetical protein [Kribbella sp. NPDC055071]